MPDVEPLSLAPLAAAPVTTSVEMHVGEGAPQARPEPAPIGAPPAAPPHQPDAVAVAIPAIIIPNVMREVERLRGMTLAYWQDHVERTMATGRAILASGSPQAAARLQVTYLQSSLASGVAHAGAWARLSTEIARDMMPFRGR